MEQREVQRLSIEIPVEFVVLGQDASRQQGLIRDVSEQGLSLITPTMLEKGSFLRIEIEDAAFFGEVKYCNPCQAGAIAGLYIEHVLMGKSDRSRLLALASQHSSRPPSHVRG